jgi:hypothetical protein
MSRLDLANACHLACVTVCWFEYLQRAPFWTRRPNLFNVIHVITCAGELQRIISKLIACKTSDQVVEH